MKSSSLLCCLLAVICLGVTAAGGCASTSDDELAKQKAEQLRRQRELEREMREKLRLEARRRAQEEEEKRSAREETYEKYLTVVDTLKASSQPLSAIAVSADGKLLACGTARGQLKILEIAGGIRAAAVEHKEAIRAMAFSRDSSLLYTGGADETLVIWDTASGQVKKKVHDFFMTVGGVAAPPEGTGLAAGDGKKVVLLDEGGILKRSLGSKAYGIGALQFIPGGRKMAVGSRGGLVEIWDTAADSPEHSMRRHTGAVQCITIESSGKTMLSGGTNRLIVLWDIEKGKAIRVYEGHRSAVTGVQYIPGTEHLVSSDDDGWLFVWDKATSKIVSKLHVSESGSVTSLALSPDGKRLYAALSEGTVAVLEFGKDE